MQINKTKNAARNLAFGSIQKVVNIIMPFITRTAMLYFLGAEYLGLNSLFTSVLQVLNLAELGVGSAMIFSMYKPIAEDDNETICALMRLYKIYYRIIGIVILIAGVCITPFISHLIKQDVPQNINIYVLYLLNLGSTVLSYWLFAYKNIINAIFVSKMYPQYEAKGDLPKEKIKDINQRVRDLFTAKVGGTVVNSADSIVISAFMGLTALAMYNNYYYIMNSVIMFVYMIFTAIGAGVGHSLVTASLDKNYKDFNTLTFIVSWICGFCISCFYSLYQPFMKIWVGEKLMFNNIVVMMFCAYFYLYIVCGIFSTYKDSAGIWHEDRYRPLIGAVVNLALNVMFVKTYGVYAILMSTIISYLIINIPWLIYNVFHLLFKVNPLKYLGRLFVYTCVSLVACYITSLCTRLILIEGLVGLILKLVVCIVISNLVMLICYFKNNELTNCIGIVKRIIKR